MRFNVDKCTQYAWEALCTVRSDKTEPDEAAYWPRIWKYTCRGLTMEARVGKSLTEPVQAFMVRLLFSSTTDDLASAIFSWAVRSNLCRFRGWNSKWIISKIVARGTKGNKSSKDSPNGVVDAEFGPTKGGI